jgi:hypothetical protein
MTERSSSREYGFGASKSLLLKLPRWKRVAFMLSCCERMLPNFARFAEETAFGDIAVLRQALDAAWDLLQDDVIPANLNELTLACGQQAPHTEMFTSPFTSAAGDAANAAATTLEQILGGEPGDAMAVATLATDSVDLYAQECLEIAPDGAQGERKILDTNLMKAEINKQHAALDLLREIEQPRSIVVKKLRQDWSLVAAGSLAE